ncbi:unnamed protein product [Arctia plantaginis]|uniref:Uncharacterized protein n=1 Tax=Arctia plantaginis TaxID=874455 RepID=A0A8S1B0G2_ARCPL|nr:unnamed protein product [Arctia plantaginis]
MTSVERGENVTVLACMNAAGQYIPPFVLFKGVRKRDDFLLGMPPGTEVAMTEIFVHPPSEDWIQCNACEEWCHEKCANRGGGGKDHVYVHYVPIIKIDLIINFLLIPKL